MKHFTIYHGHIVDANADGSVGINARIFATCDEGDTRLEGAAALVRQANAAALLLPALERLVLRCDGDEGVRPDGSNIQTMEAHAIMERIRVAELPHAPKVMP